MSKLLVVVGGQYGSEGKGAVVAHLVKDSPNPPVVVRVGGPNAGHTVYDDSGHRLPLRQVPAGVVRDDATLAIAAGSEVDPAVLWAEVEGLEAKGHDIRNRLYLDPGATMLQDGHRQQGESERRFGSTGKGVGVARAERVRRRALTVKDGGRDWPGVLFPVRSLVRSALRSGQTVVVEGTQGYGLGLHTSFYPYTTSADCTAVDILAQAQISPWVSGVGLEVWVVLRTFPIRVASVNGSSGPLHHEVSWERLAEESRGYIHPERTTVTQNVRRVGRWDRSLAAEAVAANGGAPVARAALTMFDYWFPELAGRADEGALQHVAYQSALAQVEREINATVQLVGTGPNDLIRRWR